MFHIPIQQALSIQVDLRRVELSHPVPHSAKTFEAKILCAI
jgi:hypothetical protein